MKKTMALLLLALYAPFAFACTTFLLTRDGKHYFGRNYDWITGNGMVMVNARGQQKASLWTRSGNQFNWVSKFGSVTFNQYGKENPTGGMNEKGLVVELMWLEEAQYPQPDKRGALDVLQWIQYQLDCSATVDDVLRSDSTVRIARAASAPLHYLVADASGAAATIEFLNGKMVVHKGTDMPYPVLTNTTYSESVKQTSSSIQNTSQRFADNSVDRFATACRMVAQFKEPTTVAAPVDYAFSILNKVSQGEFTRWSIVYDINGRGVHFITHNRQERKFLAFKDVDFACTASPVGFPLESQATGNIASSLAPLDARLNRTVLEQSMKESSPRIQAPKDEVDKVAAYFSELRCATK